jgi:hypothetical protein
MWDYFGVSKTLYVQIDVLVLMKIKEMGFGRTITMESVK